MAYFILVLRGGGGVEAGVLLVKVFVRREKKISWKIKDRISRLCLFYFKLINAWWIRVKVKTFSLSSRRPWKFNLSPPDFAEKSLRRLSLVTQSPIVILSEMALDIETFTTLYIILFTHIMFY